MWKEKQNERSLFSFPKPRKERGESLSLEWALDKAKTVWNDSALLRTHCNASDTLSLSPSEFVGMHRGLKQKKATLVAIVNYGYLVNLQIKWLFRHSALWVKMQTSAVESLALFCSLQLITIFKIEQLLPLQKKIELVTASRSVIDGVLSGPLSGKDLEVVKHKELQKKPMQKTSLRTLFSGVVLFFHICNRPSLSLINSGILTVEDWHTHTIVLSRTLY